MLLLYCCRFLLFDPLTLHLHKNHCKGENLEQGYMYMSHPRQLIFLRKSGCLGCAVLLCLVVCLNLLASFILPSHLSLKHLYTLRYIHTYIHTYIHVYRCVVPPPHRAWNRATCIYLECIYMYMCAPSTGGIYMYMCAPSSDKAVPPSPDGHTLFC